MLIGIVDDGVGFVPALCKLRQTLSADYVCVVCEGADLSNCNANQLMSVGIKATRLLEQMGCKAAVLSSVALSSRCLKYLADSPLDVYGCDPPVMHGLTYTASKVLVAGDPYALRNLPSGVIAVPMPEFPLLAENNDEHAIVRHISEKCEPFSGQFDCIVLANSSMNLYKYCFARVFPGLKIFDSLEGVARRIRKSYKKLPREEGSCRVVNLDGKDICEKYSFFTE